MEYRWIETLDEFRPIAPEWDKALLASGNYNPFLLSDFIITWWQHYLEDYKVEVLTIFDDGRIVGGLPLYLRQGSAREGFARLFCYVGGPAANYTEPLYASRDIKVLPVLCQALTQKNDWDVLQLTDVPAHSPLTDESRAICNGRFSVALMQTHINWSINLSGGTDNYLVTISKKLKRDLRARRRSAVKHYGELALKQIGGRKEVEHYFDLYLQFSRSAFSSRNRKSSFEDRRLASFFKDFLILMDQRQRLDAHVLLAGENPLAISFGYRFGKGFHWALTAFDYTYRNVRPGYLLIEELIREMTRRGETYYNWYGHDRFYKAQWCNQQTPLYRLVLVRPTWKGLCYQAFQRAEKALRSNQAVLNLLRKAKRAYTRTPVRS